MAQIDIERGDRAKEVLDNAIYQEAYVAVEQELIRLWKLEKSTEARESLWLEQRLLSKVRTRLETVMASGTLERERSSILHRTMDMVRTGLR